MKALFAGGEHSCPDFLRDLVDETRDMQMSGTAVEADVTSDFVVPWQLRKILDRCPICKGGFRNHTYSLLATVAMNDEAGGVTRLAQLLRCMRECRWRDVPGFRQWVADADAILAFAFRCEKGRVGIVTVFSPADSNAPDKPLQFTILSLEEGKKLLTVAHGVWLHIHPALSYMQ